MSYQVQVEHNVPVPMRDGVVLAADVHRPASGGEVIEGALPVLLQRTPYDKAREDRIKEAKKFERDAEREWKRRNRNNRRKYTPKKNPHGPPEFSMKLSIVASGICKGVRDGKVTLDKCTTLSYGNLGAGR